MEKTLYLKFNNLRSEDYRIATSILEEDGVRFVKKTPLEPGAAAHLKKMTESYEALREVYEHVTPLKPEPWGEGIRYPFVKGEALDADIDYAGDDPALIAQKINEIFKITLGIKPEYIKGGLVAPANIDSNIPNFIKSGDTVYLLDYEWVETEPVELDFIRYRAVLYNYIEHAGALSGRISREDYLELFGFTPDLAWKYRRMEEDFQEKVQGRRHRDAYTHHYEKGSGALPAKMGEKDRNIAGLQERIRVLESALDAHMTHVAYQEATIGTAEYMLSTVKKSIKNPFWGIKNAFCAGGRYLRKLATLYKLRGESSRVKERELEISGDYQYWIEGLEAGYDLSEKFDYNPLISLLVPVMGSVDEAALKASLDSVEAQVYKNHETVMVNDKSTIKEALNTALSRARGEFIAILTPGDILSPNALYENVKLLNENRDYDLVYSDEDMIEGAGGRRLSPYFKPDFSPDTLLCLPYICHLAVYRKSLAQEVAGAWMAAGGEAGPGSAGAWMALESPESREVGVSPDSRDYLEVAEYDLVLRITEMTKRIGHVDKVLYHKLLVGTAGVGGYCPEAPGGDCPEASGGESLASAYAMEATLAIKNDALKRRGVSGYATPVPGYALSRVVYDTLGQPLVSVIIPTKDHPDILNVCLGTLAAYTGYREFEIIVIDNGSSPENKLKNLSVTAEFGADYYHEPMDFNFSKMCNRGASLAKGEYLLFLNDDTQVIDPDWMSIMLGAAMQPHAGAVGAKLFYSDGKSLQHTGVVNTISGPGHMLQTLPDSEDYYYYQNRLDFDVLAVTAACLMVSRAKFDEVGGFDENFAVAYNDVDFCFKLHEKGYFNIIRNDAVMIHHESLSRGQDMVSQEKTRRLFGERERLYAAHPGLDSRDPFYNPRLNQFMPNFDLNLDEGYPFTCERTDEVFGYGEVRRMCHKFDFMTVDWGIHIYGWVLFREEVTDYRDIYLLLEGVGEADNYLIRARRMLTPDVGALHKRIPLGNFAGFRTMSRREQLPDGAYRVYFLHRGKKFDSGETLYVGVSPEG